MDSASLAETVYAAVIASESTAGARMDLCAALSAALEAIRLHVNEGDPEDAGEYAEAHEALWSCRAALVDDYFNSTPLDKMNWPVC